MTNDPFPGQNVSAYRVVGVRADKSRMLICEHVTKHQADMLKQSLEVERVFESVAIEFDREATPDTDLPCFTSA